MRKLIIAIGIILFAIAGISYAQLTGSDVERHTPPTLYPEPGPGESRIIRELQETNRLLQQQNVLLEEQNKLMRSVLDRNSKK